MNESAAYAKSSTKKSFIANAIVVPILDKKYSLYIYCVENVDHASDIGKTSSSVNVTGDNQAEESLLKNLVDVDHRIDYDFGFDLRRTVKHSSSMDKLIQLDLDRLFIDNSNSILKENSLSFREEASTEVANASVRMPDRNTDQNLHSIDANNNTLSNSVKFQLSIDSDKGNFRTTARTPSPDEKNVDADDKAITKAPRNQQPLLRIKFAKKTKKFNRVEETEHASDDGVLSIQQPRLRQVRFSSQDSQLRIKKRYFYHYTSHANLESIKNDRLLRGSKGVYGHGVYGTSKPPQTKYLTLLRSNYLIAPNPANVSTDELIPTILPFVECYIRLTVDDLGAHLGVPDALRQDVYMYPGDIDLNTHKFSTGVRKKYDAECTIVYI